MARGKNPATNSSPLNDWFNSGADMAEFSDRNIYERKVAHNSRFGNYAPKTGEEAQRNMSRALTNAQDSNENFRMQTAPRPDLVKNSLAASASGEVTRHPGWVDTSA